MDDVRGVKLSELVGGWVGAFIFRVLYMCGCARVQSDRTRLAC